MSGIVKGLFGSKSSSEKILQQYRPTNFASQGLTGRFNQGSNTFNVQRTAAGENALQGVVGAFRQRAAAFRGLRPQVAPGFGRLTRERVTAIRDAGSRAVGNLREELSRRRIMGSSFGNDQLASVEMDFGQAESLARAETFVQELGMTQDLIAQEFDASINAATTIMNQLNLESSVAGQMSSQVSALMQANLTAQAQFRAEQEQGTGDFLGTLIGAFMPTSRKEKA